MIMKKKILNEIRLQEQVNKRLLLVILDIVNNSKYKSTEEIYNKCLVDAKKYIENNKKCKMQVFFQNGGDDND